MRFISITAFSAACLVGCGGTPSLIDGDGSSAGAAGTSTSSSGSSAGNAGTLGSGSGSGTGTGGNAGSQGDAGVDPVDPCLLLNCSEKEHCTLEAGKGSCTANTCQDLEGKCSETESCTTTPEGAYCKSISCATTLDCESDQYCSSAGLCVGQLCTPGTSRCDGSDVIYCTQSGSEEYTKFSCSSPSTHFTSECGASMSGAMSCTCEGDWDCPEYSRCDSGMCSGTGVAPTCFLPANPFNADDTDAEITWGGGGPWTGTTSDVASPTSPYGEFVQVVTTPVVINLTDDNSDGKIDENDIPEIVFLSFKDKNQYQTNGILRAIQGGGAERGEDLFAVCNPSASATQSYYRGAYVGDPVCASATPVFDPTATIAAGDIDGDGLPEIVVLGETSSSLEKLYILNRKGELLLETPALPLGKGQNIGSGSTSYGSNPAVSLANIDHVGLAEIIVGRNVISLTKDGSGNFQIENWYQGASASGRNGQGPVSCVADIQGDEQLEIIAGAVAYTLPAAGGTVGTECYDGLCARALDVVWSANGSGAPSDGFCAIADVIGADGTTGASPTNPLDEKPEVVLVSSGNIFVLNGETGTLIISQVLDGSGGGPPNVDDFDGDGFPEIGTATGIGYYVVDLQTADDTSCPAWSSPVELGMNPARTPPAMSCTDHAGCGDTSKFGCNTQIGECVCLHNGWRLTTQDGSSRVTGSSVFDFNGDGAAEVVYNDECRFRVIGGQSGDVLLEKWSESRTRVEYPIVADVDRDGNAEIVFATSNESGFCNSQRPSGADPIPSDVLSQFNAGIEVWGDLSDSWVPARRIWNQHSYHVTNVLESGAIPTHEQKGWKNLNGRSYNTYRSNPRNYNVAPDLTVSAVQFTSPGSLCGTLGSTLNITAQISNLGDWFVGAEVTVGMEGYFGSSWKALLDENGDEIRIALGTTLNPKTSIVVGYTGYQASYNSESNLPSMVRVTVDPDSKESECKESNNKAEVAVTGGNPKADLLTTVNSVGCSSPNITVNNAGSLDASSVELGIFAGDPNAGGTLIKRYTIPSVIVKGESWTGTVSFTLETAAKIYVKADVDNSVAECDESNNFGSHAAPTGCGVIIID